MGGNGWRVLGDLGVRLNVSGTQESTRLVSVLRNYRASHQETDGPRHTHSLSPRLFSVPFGRVLFDLALSRLRHLQGPEAACVSVGSCQDGIGPQVPAEFADGCSAPAGGRSGETWPKGGPASGLGSRNVPHPHPRACHQRAILLFGTTAWRMPV